MNYSIWRSKTFWTIFITVALAVGNAVVPFMSPDIQATLTTLLGMLAAYFHNLTAVNNGATN